jgi:hypothetical protein
MKAKGRACDYVSHMRKQHKVEKKISDSHPLRCYGNEKDTEREKF